MRRGAEEIEQEESGAYSKESIMIRDRGGAIGKVEAGKERRRL